MTSEVQKKAAAIAAVKYIQPETVVGVGTGTTINFFIEALASIQHKIEGAVASSIATADLLKKVGIRVFDLNVVDKVPVYVDGADAINEQFQLIKGRGGALTREKIIATVAEQFICIADETKVVKNFNGEIPLPIEVIPMARSYVARQIVKLGGNPVYRQGYVTDNGNCILDIHNLAILEPIKTEERLNNIVGVVCHGLFAYRAADIILLGTPSGVISQRAK